MSEYENVIGGKLKLKGKALDVKSSGGIKKKKKAKKFQTDGDTMFSSADYSKETVTDIDNGVGKSKGAKSYDHLTPAERRYLEQWEKIDVQRMVKMASKSHRDRIQEFNQYLANLTEHYDIPKVGPG